MKNKTLILTIIILAFVIILIPLRGSYAFYSDNKDLEIINTRVGNWKSTIDYLRMNDKNNNLSKDTPGDMYRYQGTDDVANWICFGTTENCGANDELVDKYMYRIIGITEEGELYLLKETFLKQGDTIGFAWNDKYETAGTGENVCENKICPEWGSNTLYKRLNGTSNGLIKGTGSYANKANTDIFVDNEYYDYLKSGDKSNGGEVASKWYQLIVEHDWMYGDIGDGAPLNTYNGQTVYEIETGKINVKHYVGTDGKNTEEIYKWVQKTAGKISLMYIHDYYYGYYDGLSEESRGNAGNFSQLKNSWIHYQKDGYNSSQDYEWISVRFGINNATASSISARLIGNNGSLHWNMSNLSYSHGARPVFYLSSNAKISYGTGTKENPYIIVVN